MYLDDLIEFSIKLDNYVSNLDDLALNNKLPLQIAGGKRNFAEYLLKIEDGKLITKEGIFSPNTHRNEWVDWIITESGQLKFGHGHSFLSGNADKVKNAGTAFIVNGKIEKIANGSGHYKPNDLYVNDVINFFKELNIISDKYNKIIWKYK